MTKAATAEKLPAQPIDGGVMAHNAKVKPLEPRRLADPDFGWRCWEATVPVEVTRETVLDGRLWRFAANRIRRGDRIAWRNDSLTLFGELVCVGCDVATGNMEMRELWHRAVVAQTLPETERCGFTAKDLGIHDGWAIVRDEDQHVMAKNIASYDEAQRRIKTEFVPNRNNMVAREGQRHYQATN